ncbi:MAG: alanine racemase [Patescibacteria group bacterium]
MKLFIKNLIRRNRQPKYSPLIGVYISKSAILHNYEQFKKLSNKPVAPVLKSNAYGHGLIEVATIIEETKPPFIVIDSLFEAHALRNNGIKSKLFIIGYTRPSDISKAALQNVSFAITSIEALKEICEYKNHNISIHLKIDTGMHRQGVLINQVDECIAMITSSKHISLQGICSHLADADTDNSAHTESQITAWNSLVKKFKSLSSSFPSLVHFHVSNSAGHAHEKKIDSTVSRLGIGLYGLDSSDTIKKENIILKPALTMSTVISSVKTLKKNGLVGYNGTFEAPQDLTIATIPMGYFEGIDRRLSSKGFVYIKNTPCPIIGRVSMNITTIDVSAVPNVSLNDNVDVISPDNTRQNSIVAIARLCQTIPYEIAVHIPSHLRRIVTE